MSFLDRFRKSKETKREYTVGLNVFFKGYAEPKYTMLGVDADSEEEAKEAAKDIIMSASYASQIERIDTRIIED